MYGLSIKMMVIGVVLLSVFVLPQSSLYAKDTPSKIAAKVGDRTIAMEELEREVASYAMRYQNMKGKLPPALMKQLRQQAINNLINREVLLMESKKKGIKINKEEVTSVLESIRNRFGSEEKFAEALKAMKLTPDVLEQQYINKATIETLLDQEIISKIKIKDEEAKAYFDANTDEFKQSEQVRARHILIKVDLGADDKVKKEARQKLADIEKKIQAGEDFAELAKKHSEGPTKVKGGDLGYFGKGQMVKPFEDVAFKLATNEVSSIVETRFGFHLIKVVDHKPAQEAVFSAQKDQVVGKLRQEQINKKIGAYIEQLRKDANVENLVE